MTEKNPFSYHGLELEDHDDEWVSSCFNLECENPDNHLYINKEKLLYNCKVCDNGGTVYTFLTRLIKDSCESTTDEDYKEFSSQKGIPVKTLKNFSVCKSVLTEEWMIPTINGKGNVTNIHVYRDFGKGPVLSSTPTCSLNFFNLQTVKTEVKPLIICEGHLDTIAMDYILRRNKQRSNYELIGVPGATTFKKYYADTCANRDVILFYDNDSAGEKGIERVCKICNEHNERPRSIQYVLWPEELPKGYDVRDLLTDTDPSETWDTLNTFLETYGEMPPESDTEEYVPDILPLPCESFSELCQRLIENNTYLNQSYIDTFAVMLATHIAPLAFFGQKDPLWMVVVGPPSSGKTMLAQMIAADKAHAYYVSKITGLHTGSKAKSDPLLGKINGKNLIIKDWTVLMTAPSSVRDTVYSELRDAFDGSTHVEYRNDVDSKWDRVSFGLTACSTDAIRRDMKTELGERFLLIDILDDDHDPGKQIELASVGILNKLTKALRHEKVESFDSDARTQYTQGFINRLKEKLSDDLNVSFPPENLKKINALVQIVGIARTKVERAGREGHLVYRPRPEMGVRMNNQFLKLALLLAIVLDKPTVDADIYRILKKIANDTASDLVIGIMRALADSRAGLTKEELRKVINLPKTTTHKYLQDLEELNVVRWDTIDKDSPGHPEYLYRLSDDLQNLWETAEM